MAVSVLRSVSWHVRLPGVGHRVFRLQCGERAECACETWWGFKQVLDVKRSTCNDVVLRETGQLPLEFYWFRAIGQHVCFEKAGRL